MKCVVCGMEMDSIKESIDQGWTPYFYESDVERGPACPDCSRVFLHRTGDGEMELKKEYRGKIQYKHHYFQEVTKEEILIGIAIENTMQSILN